jgi:hypothetical protein
VNIFLRFFLYLVDVLVFCCVLPSLHFDRLKMQVCGFVPHIDYALVLPKHHPIYPKNRLHSVMWDEVQTFYRQFEYKRYIHYYRPECFGLGLFLPFL